MRPTVLGMLPMLILAPTPGLCWTADDIRASRIQHVDPAALSDAPVHEADPFNLLLVVGDGGRELTVLDGDRLEPIHRLGYRAALQGEPSFTAAGRYAFLATHDGWISKLDLWNLVVIAEVRAGTDTRNVVASPDGRYVAVANRQPATLVLFDGDLQLRRSIEVTGRDGAGGVGVAAVHLAPARHSFVAILEQLPEVWEISFDPQADDIALGFVHDHRMREGRFVPGYLNPRRTVLGAALEGVVFAADHSLLVGSTRDGAGQVVSLDARRAIAGLALTGIPAAAGGICFDWRGRPVVAVASLEQATVTIIDLVDLDVAMRIATPAPAGFLRSHEDSRLAFAGTMAGSGHPHPLHVIDKQSLEFVLELAAASGPAPAQVAFTRDGRRALLGLVSPVGAILVLDGDSLEELKRIPIHEPAGVYNVWNNIPRQQRGCR